MMSASHEKVMIYEQAYVTMGSHNFTANSVSSCEEDVLCTASVSVVRTMYTHFLDVWEKGAALTSGERPDDRGDRH